MFNTESQKVGSFPTVLVVYLEREKQPGLRSNGSRSNTPETRVLLLFYFYNPTEVKRGP